MNIGDVLIAFKGDMGGVNRAVDEAASKSQAAGTTIGDRLSKGMSAGFKVASGAASGFLLLAAKGAADMQRIVGSFQAETGATAEEAKRAGDAINDMSRRNTQSLDEIGRALTKVHTDLGLVGDEAAATAQQFLTFGKATGQDAAQAVLDFDDILDAWGLEAKDAQGVMDALIVSHQRYGGSIEDNQRLLAQLAPTLQAANMDWEDGLGLLNMFARSGVGAEAATTALNRALASVKSPEELNALIADIAGTVDPFERARKAAEVFGNRAGPKLAQALADSGGDLSKFNVNVGEAAGATDAAADAMTTDTDRIKMALGQVAAAARDLGADAGPVAMTLASLVTMFPALPGKFGDLGKRLGTAVAGPLKAAVMGALLVDAAGEQALSAGGTRMGGIIGKAAGIAAGAAIVLGIAAIATEYSDDLDRAARDIHNKMFGDAGQGDGMLAGTLADTIGDAMHEAWYQIGQNDPLISEGGKALRRLLKEGAAALDSAELDAAFEDVVIAAWNAARDSGATDEAAAEAARVAGQAYLDGFGKTLAAPAAVTKTQNVLAGFLAAAQGADAMQGPYSRAGNQAGSQFLLGLGAGIHDGWQAAVIAGMAAAQGQEGSTPESVRMAGIAAGQRYLAGLGEVVTDEAGRVLDTATKSGLSTPMGPQGALSAAGQEGGRTWADAMAESAAERLQAAGGGRGGGGAFRLPAINLGLGFVGDIVEGVVQGAPKALSTIGDVLNAAASVMTPGLALGLRIGRSIPGQIAAGMQDEANTLDPALATLRDILENGMSPKRLGMRAVGAKMIEDVEAGIKSRKFGAREAAMDVALEAIGAIADSGLHGPRSFAALGRYKAVLFAGGMDEAGVRAALAARGVNQRTIDALFEGGDRAERAGRGKGDRFGDGVRSKGEKAHRDGRHVRDRAADGMSGTPHVYTYGAHFVDRYLDGVRSKYAAAIEAGRGIIRAVAGPIKSSEPPPDAPLEAHMARTYGSHLVDRYLDGVRKRYALARDSGEGLVQAVVEGAQMAAAMPVLDLLTDPRQVTSKGTLQVAVDHTVHADPGALPPGMSEQAVAEFLNRGFDAQPFVLSLGHRAGID